MNGSFYSSGSIINKCRTLIEINADDSVMDAWSEMSGKKKTFNFEIAVYK
jgi:hypothetical protein